MIYLWVQSITKPSGSNLILSSGSESMDCQTINLPFDEDKAEDVKRSLVDLCKLGGALYNYRSPNGDYVDHVPVAVMPFEMKRADYDKLLRAQEIWGDLLVKLSHDQKFIERAFRETQKCDAFVRHLFEVY